MAGFRGVHGKWKSKSQRLDGNGDFQPLDVDHPIETTISRRFKVTHLDPLFGDHLYNHL